MKSFLLVSLGIILVASCEKGSFHGKDAAVEQFIGFNIREDFKPVSGPIVDLIEGKVKKGAQALLKKEFLKRPEALLKLTEKAIGIYGGSRRDLKSFSDPLDIFSSKDIVQELADAIVGGIKALEFQSWEKDIFQYPITFSIIGALLDNATEGAYQLGRDFSKEGEAHDFVTKDLVKTLEKAIKMGDQNAGKLKGLVNHSLALRKVYVKWTQFLKTRHPYAFIEFEAALEESKFLCDFYLTDKTERSSFLDHFKMPKEFELQLLDHLRASKFLLKLNALSHLPLAFYHGYTNQHLPKNFLHKVHEKYFNAFIHEYVRLLPMAFELLWNQVRDHQGKPSIKNENVLPQAANILP